MLFSMINIVFCLLMIRKCSSAGTHKALIALKQRIDFCQCVLKPHSSLKQWFGQSKYTQTTAMV